jgi:protein involved in polysaccharide export with SLBB domain
MHPSLPAFASLLLTLAVLSSGCATTRPAAARNLPVRFTPAPVAGLPPVDPALLQRPQAEHRLGPGDVLDIEVLGDLGTRTRTVVGPDGKIYFYVLPGIDVWGMTMSEARARVVREMQNFIREEQPISMTLRTAASQRIWVLGRLNRPGVYTMTGPTSLLEAIAQAGGLSPTTGVMTTAGTMGFASARGATDEAADLRRAFVIRQGKVLRVDFDRLLRNGDLSQNIYLQSDDFVYLPSATMGDIHVLGAVGNPRTVQFTGGQTLVQAIAEAGGILPRESHPSEVAVVRGSLAEPKVAIVDLKEILSGQTPDVLLEAQDIVYVPHSPYRVLTRYVNIILDTFARTVGVNEGARAVSGSATPVGVNVPLGSL